MYTLLIKDLRIQAIHGLLPLEKLAPQEFLINSEVTCALNETYAKADVFNETLCYGKIREAIITLCTENSYDTLEALTYKINTYILEKSDCIKSVTTSVEKTKLLNDCRVGVRLVSTQK